MSQPIDLRPGDEKLLGCLAAGMGWTTALDAAGMTALEGHHAMTRLPLQITPGGRLANAGQLVALLAATALHHKHAVRTASATGPDIRAWAAAHGVPCPSRGRIPRRVREAFEQAGEAR